MTPAKKWQTGVFFVAAILAFDALLIVELYLDTDPGKQLDKKNKNPGEGN